MSKRLKAFLIIYLGLVVGTVIVRLIVDDTFRSGFLHPDRDCGDFSSHWEAQRFYEQQGGPARDPHHLDADRDGIACERLN